MNCNTNHAHICNRSRLSTFKVSIYLLFFIFLSINVYASDIYIATSDLNLRDGAGTNYKSLIVISKSDTVKLIEDTGNYWVKIEYKNKVGYTAKQFLQEIQVEEIKPKEDNLTTNETNDKSSFPAILVGLLIAIFIASVLDKSGKKHRSLSLTKFLSFFLGALGFQKFYLGETVKGILSILFCWTFIPVLIGWIDFVKFASVSEEKFSLKYNRNYKSLKKKMQDSPQNTHSESIKKEIKTQDSLSSSRKEFTNRDQSIIDISLEKFDLSVEHSALFESTSLQPPYWGHSYVYSYDEINYATSEQKKYYSYFKKKVLKGEFVDIQGYTNYAFILYFDFLKEYQYHRNIKLLEEQFKLIGQICPKTKNYTLRILQDELSNREDTYSIEKLKNLDDPLFQFENGFSEHNPYAYKLGSLYKDQLKLNPKEIDWLNKIWHNSNVFLSIEDCVIEVMRLYCLVLKELEQKWNVSNITDNITELINTELIRKKDYFESFESDIYLSIFKRTENVVRTAYINNRKISDEILLKYSTRVQTNFNKLIGDFVNELLVVNMENIKPPSKETLIELNAQNVNRWKIDFKKLTDSFQNNEINIFINGIINLEETNQKNPNIENIFFEASKFVASYDKVQSLKYYAKYIYYDLKSMKFDNKELTKTIQKSLFKTQEQFNDFKRIITELIKTSDIERALEEIAKIYIPKRKRIQLDKSKIKEVEQKHDGTVELLNGYLETERDDFSEDKSFDNTDGTEIDVITPVPINSIFVAGIRMGKVQEELLKKFIENSFEIRHDEVDKFAIDNGMFKNQLIDSINEACSEYLDGESLIEENDETYVIEESYFKEIAK
ncbi:MAG TPA: tellurite resistance TerB C-terminal domain-containing protein [Prolixibacteraceae bacterium]|nr:tellurite resistance TerB C-terminal domain-containing protein [Prolixibacteraceae bacterium]